jgi:transcriptional regulator with XRE-family HTH domain
MNADQVEQRIKAGRLLRGMDQQTMDRLGAEHGLGRQELSRVERGALPLTAVRRYALRSILRLPDRWFVDEDTDVIVGLYDAGSVTGAQLRALVAVVDDAVEQGLLKSFDEARVVIEPGPPPREGEEVVEVARPSVAARARAAAQRLEDTPATSPETRRAAGDEGRER